MKKIILIAAITLGLLIVSLSSYAQQKPFSHYSEETLDAINATPEQREAIKELAADYRQKITEIKAQRSSMTEDEYKAEVKKLNEYRSKEYAKITTSEQKEKLKELRAEHKKKQQE